MIKVKIETIVDRIWDRHTLRAFLRARTVIRKFRTARNSAEFLPRPERHKSDMTHPGLRYVDRPYPASGTKMLRQLCGGRSNSSSRIGIRRNVSLAIATPKYPSNGEHAKNGAAESDALRNDYASPTFQCT